MAKNTANPLNLNWDFGITGVERYLNAPPYNGSLQIHLLIRKRTVGYA